MSHKARGKSKKTQLFGFALCAVFVAFCPSTSAQQQKKIPRIGFVSPTGNPSTPGSEIEAFRQSLGDLGYIEGKTILVEYRYLEGKVDRNPILVAELLQLKVDALVVVALSSIREAKQATNTVPIVIATLQDPVAAGLVDSLARPGGNITGVTRLTRELSGKRLELLKEAVPGLTRVGVLWDVDFPGVAVAFKEYEAAARVLKIPLQSFEVRGPSPDLEEVFRSATKERTGALLTIRSPALNGYTKEIGELAKKKRLPSMCEASTYAEAGCMMAYTASDAESFRRAAVYVDKVLKGAKPAELPVEQPTKFEFVVNLKTAKQIGITIPPNVLARADKVIK